MELLVVVVIIGILATLAIVNFWGHLLRSRAELTQVQLKRIAEQVELFRVNHGRCPDALVDLVVRPGWVEEKTWPPDGYVSEVPKDGWGRELVYRRTSVSYELLSYGEDGREGGEGPAADLWSRPRR